MPVRERRHLRRYLAFVSHSTPAKESPTYVQGVEYVAGRLSELLDELSRITGQPAAPQDQPKTDAQPASPEALKQRFLAVINLYTDLQVEKICGINHETVRQYDAGEWPKRGPNDATITRMWVMIRHHEAVLEEDAIVSGETLPQYVAGLITFARAYQDDPDFAKRYPDLGWISVTDDMAKALRDRKLLTIYDEFIWRGYKLSQRFDPETATRVTLEDVGLDISDFFKAIDDEEEADSNK